MSTVQPYPSGTQWKYRNKQSGYEFTSELTLEWEPNGSPMSDDYTPDEITASGLWRKWVDKYGTQSHDRHPEEYKAGEVPIYWSVSGAESGTFEAAPFQRHDYLDEDFTTFFTHPVNAKTRERMNWLRLPVADRGWNETTWDKGGFIQEASGWKPSPFQIVMDAYLIGRAAGLYVPDGSIA
jgi:hypothetical protein